MTIGTTRSVAFSKRSAALLEEMQRLSVGLPLRALDVQLELTLEAGRVALGGQTWFAGVPVGEGTRVLAALSPTGEIHPGAEVSAEMADLRMAHFSEAGFDPVRIGLLRSEPLSSEEEDLLDLVATQATASLSQHRRYGAVAVSVERIVQASYDELHARVVREVARVLGARRAILTTVVEGAPGRVSIDAIWDAEGQAAVAPYELAGTPCEAVFRDGSFVTSLSGDEFASVPPLHSSEFQAYAGVRLEAPGGEVLGHLAVLDVEPFDDDRNPARFLSVVQAPVGAAIARFHADQARRQSEDRLELALGAAGIGVSDTDLTTGELFIDERSSNLYGYTPAELSSVQELDRLIHPDDRDVPMKAIQRNIESGTEDFSVEHRILHRDGSTRWTYARGKLLRDAEGTPNRIITAGIDITDRKWRERVVAELAQQVLSEHGHGVFEVLALHVARALEVEIVALVDFSNNGTLIRTRSFVRDGEALPEVEFPREKYGGAIPKGAIRFGRPHIAQFSPHFQLVGEDGPDKFIGVPLLDSGDELLGFLLASESGEVERDRFAESVLEIAASRAVSELVRERDEEARRALEAKVQHAQKLESLGVLAGGIAHDFNNLLTAVLGNAGLALGSLSDGSPARERVKQIELAARRAAELTEQMLAYSGRGSLEMSALDVNSVVQELAELLTTVISKKAQMTVECGRGIGSVEADASQIRQIFMNLITNASDSLEGEAGGIRVQTGVVSEIPEGLVHSWVPDDGLFVVVEVADTGCGMDEATREQVFDPFFTTKFTGRGLGMAAVVGIVRQHRGAIELDSEPGRGTAVRVYLPRISEENVAVNSTTLPSDASNLALVVDDEDMVRELLCASLEDAGFTPLSAGNGDEAKKLFEENASAIRIVLMDLSMPDIGAGELYDALSAHESCAKYILVSGYPEQEAREVFGREGLSAFLQKPFRIDALVDLVHSVVE